MEIRRITDALHAALDDPRNQKETRTGYWVGDKHIEIHNAIWEALWQACQALEEGMVS